MNEEKKKTVDRKKYWLKLDKDYLKSPQMKVIQSMPNGKDYIIFYLKLMLESVETVGHLRFTSLVPYNPEMLASITDTNVDIARSAVDIFCELGMMKIFDDGTIFMPDVPKMTGNECDSAERVRKFRDKQKQELLQCNDNVTKCNDNKDKEKEEEKEKEIKEEVEEEIEDANLVIGRNADLFDDKDDEKSADLFSFVQEAFGKTFNSIEYEFISSWEDNELTRYAIREAVLNQARNLKYVDKILMTWKDKGYQTIDDVIAAEKKRKKYGENKSTDEEILKRFSNAKSIEASFEEQQEMEQILEGF